MKILLLIFFLLSIPVSAYSGTIDLGYRETGNASAKGYVSTIDFKDEISDVVTLDAHYEYGEVNEIITNDSGHVAVNYDPEINDKWGVWLDERVGYDNIIGVKFENKVGFGTRYYIIKKEIGEDKDKYMKKLSISGGVLYHYVAEEDEDDSEIIRGTGTGRYSLRLKYSDKIIESVYFYQPSVEDNDDYITIWNSTVKIIAGVRYSVKIFLKKEYRSIYDTTNTIKGVSIGINY